MAEPRQSARLEALVQEIIQHPGFRQAVNGPNGESATPPPNQSQRTPRQELQQLFRRGNASVPTQIPQFGRRATWTPTPTRGQSARGGRFNPYGKSGKGKNVKTASFTREVVLLRAPDDRMVRGSAKAELQRLGQVMSAFKFEKSWPAEVVIEKLMDAFESTVPALANISCEPKIKILMGIGAELVEPQLTPGQTLNGEVISHIFSQRTVWVVPNESMEQTKCGPIGELEDERTEREGEGNTGEHDHSVHGGPSSSLHISTPSVNCPDQPSTSSAFVDDDEHMKDKLKEMFPNTNVDIIEEAVSDSITLEDAIDIVLEKSTEPGDPQALNNSLKLLMAKLSLKPHIKLSVDPDDLVSDAVAFYKGPKFQPTQPLRITFVGMPAIDSGGVKRQFYTDLFKDIVASNQFSMFQGPSTRIIFNYNQMALNSGLYKMLGQIISHSICQGCAAFPVLAPSMYYYIATEDINQATAYSSVSDILDEEELQYVEKVMTATDKELSDLNMEDGFLKLIQDSGLTVTVTEKNRAVVLQGLLTHLVVGKRLAMLDQFSRGLETLGVLREIRAKPAVFEPLFVSSSKLTPDQFRLRTSQEGCRDDAEALFGKLMKYTDNSSEDELKDLLKFTTGGEVLPPTGIMVDVCSASDSIYASTCLCEVIFPQAMSGWEYDDFRGGLWQQLKETSLIVFNIPCTIYNTMPYYIYHLTSRSLLMTFL